MYKSLLRFLLCSCLVLPIFVCKISGQQSPLRMIQRPGSGTQNQVNFDTTRTGSRGASAGGDSLLHRDNNVDSITIFYRFFDSTRIRSLDSSINDFTTRYPFPAHYVNLGNFGTAAHSLLFSPILKPGWDAGFHAFDIYKFNVEDTRFFQTTRPYTELGYMLGSKAEQMINITHTQNRKPNFNMAFQYRLINSPGEFQNQNTNHNSYRINGNYQSRNKRYTVYGVYVANKLLSSENGGIQYDSLLNDYRYTNRYSIATRLSGDTNATSNPFSTRIITGNVYKTATFLLRQQYDFGQRDSLIVNDSTTIQLFYPRFRFQHTFTYTKEQYEFHDYYQGPNKAADYLTYFNMHLIGDTVVYRDKWNDLQNDFSIISFPQKNNLNQFLKAGIVVENLSATFGASQKNFHNIFLNGEYRNRTRNQKWDVEATGKLYLNGLNSGDYAFGMNLKRLISQKLGYVEVGFQNVNRSPSYVYNWESSFPLIAQTSFNKENITRISGSLSNSANQLTLSAEYYLISNYSYFTGFVTASQESTLFNVLHVSAEKKFKVAKGINLYSEAHLQQTAGNPPVNLPLIFTSNRIALEGVYYKNMIYSIGLELRYHAPYKAENYSPFVGQFTYQDTTTISNRPQVNAFFNFRIKSFKAFVRAENLNTLGTNAGQIGFNKNNFSAPDYPQQGFWFRLGIWWTFIN